MDFKIYHPWYTLFGTIYYPNVTCTIGLAIRMIIFNFSGGKQLTVYTKVNENVFHFLLLLFIMVIISTLYRSIIQRTREQISKEPRPHETAVQCDIHEYSLSELTCFNGPNEGGKIYVALNGKIYDVSKDRRHYNPGGSYKMLAGRDASRAFATLSFEADSLCGHYDDLSDIDEIQKNNLYEWECIFSQKYSIVGRLVRDHRPKGLQELSMKAISKQIERCHSGSHYWDFTESLPLPTVLKKTLHNYFFEHME